MIPENTFAVGPAPRWLGLAMSVLFVLSVPFVYAGGALWRRLQRKALERSLDKIKWHKLVVAILLSFALLSPQMAYAGQTTPPPRATPELQYQRLFMAVNAIMAHMKKICKTEECGSLSAEGTALIADAQEKQKKGLLVDTDRKAFHDKLDSLLTRVRNVLIAEQLKEHPNGVKLTLPEGQTCPAAKPGLKTVVFDQDRCDLCYQVFEQAFGICTLYLGICETCALICMSVATLQFGNCIQRFCDGT